MTLQIVNTNSDCQLGDLGHVISGIFADLLAVYIVHVHYIFNYYLAIWLLLTWPSFFHGRLIRLTAISYVHERNIEYIEVADQRKEICIQ